MRRFFVHHFVCIGYIVTCYLSGIGAQTVCAALVMAETTSPCQNTWRAAPASPSLAHTTRGLKTRAA